MADPEIITTTEIKERMRKMSDRDWLNVPEDPVDIHYITVMYPTPEQRMKEALLSLADLAHGLEPGQFMVVQRHGPEDTKEGRVFTAKVYKRTEDRLYE